MYIKLTKSDLIKYGIIALLCVIISILMSTTCQLREKLKTTEDNITVIQDSMRTIQMENEELLFCKSAYILKSKEYSEYMDITDKKIKDLEKNLKSKISEISVLKSSLSIENIVIRDTLIVYKDSSKASFHYKDEWNEIGGSTVLSNNMATTTIDSMKSYVPLVIGFTENNDIFATSENPYVRFTSIDGAVTKVNKKTHKSFGFKVVLGPTVSYDPFRNNASFGIGITAGIGFGYGINF